MSAVHITLALFVSLVFIGCASASRSLSPPLPQFPVTEGIRNHAASVRVNVASNGHGSGTIIGQKDGCLILTAEHVVRESKNFNVSVTMQNAYGIDETRPAQVLRKDPARDLALLRTGRCGTGYAAELAGDDEAAAGALVYSIGFPGDQVRATTRGRVRKNPFFVHMQPAEPADFNDGILADMPAEAGSSGAGVFSAATGKLVGVHKMSFGEGDDQRAIIVSVKEVRRLLKEAGTVID